MIDRIDINAASRILKALSAAMKGQNDGKIQVWYGTGNNGKTTLQTLVRQTIPEFLCFASAWSQGIDKIDLVNKIVFINDASPKDIEKFYHSMNPSYKIILLMNEKPPVSDCTDYVEIIHFPNTFPSTGVYDVKEMTTAFRRVLETI